MVPTPEKHCASMPAGTKQEPNAAVSSSGLAPAHTRAAVTNENSSPDCSDRTKMFESSRWISESSPPSMSISKPSSQLSRMYGIW